MKTLLFTILMTSSVTQAAHYVVEAHHKLNNKELVIFKGLKVSPFADFNHPYFSRLYTVSGEVTKENLKKMSWVKNIEDTVEFKTLSLLPAQNPERLVDD